MQPLLQQHLPAWRLAHILEPAHTLAVWTGGAIIGVAAAVCLAIDVTLPNPTTGGQSCGCLTAIAHL